MSDLAIVLLVLYLVVGVLWAWFALECYHESTLPGDRRIAARLLLATPVWPLAVLYLLLRYAVPALGRGLGAVMVEATRRGSDDDGSDSQLLAEVDSRVGLRPDTQEAL